MVLEAVVPAVGVQVLCCLPGPALPGHRVVRGDLQHPAGPTLPLRIPCLRLAQREQLHCCGGKSLCGSVHDVVVSVLAGPLPEGTVPVGLLMCPLWSGLKQNVPFAL